MRVLTAILMTMLLGGCSTLDGALTNRVTLTAAMDECQVSSRWGAFSIGSDIDKRDCEAIRQGLLMRIMLMLQAQQQQQKQGGS